ncbi:restriction endonuclease subunit S [Exiguobacterium marinum]|uniref:Restriction endonuclease subunit S n=1 Tax=Exiguobacterium marinum TaxID=273528 RepID=A0ABY7X2W4_9BACL|nr:restriction endonuclease subunit S [Exiguobacterium marinum]WDH76246.1 restriction endonuclease subunit S [Exiguobacterium marinum]
MKSNNPVLRFHEFNENWVSRSIEELAKEFLGGGTPKTTISEFWNGEIPWIQSSDLTNHKVYGFTSKKKINSLAIKNSATKIIPKDSIAIVTRVGVGKIALFEHPYSTSQDFLSLSELNIDKWFGVYLLYNKLQKELKQVQGTSIKGITKSELLRKNVSLPEINEQIKLGDFFKKLDDTISLHQQELEALKQTKQGFLQKMFPKKGEILPQLRFKEFDGPWSHCKLKNLGEIKTGATPSTGNIDNYSEEGMLWITPTDIKGRVTKNSAKKLSLKGQEKARIVEPYSILVTSIASIGKNTMVESYASFNQQINSLTPFKSNDSYFLLTQSYFWSKEMKNKAASGTMQIVNKSEFSEMSFLVPEKKEQIKIGEFFKQLDKVIELKEKEIEALKETKKGFLQKMFV